MIKGASFNNEVVDSNARAVNAGGISEAQDDANALYSRINGASCELVPSAYKEGTVYAGTGINGDLTFTRAGDAWRTNGQGLIQRVPWNLLRYSEQFDNGVWTKSNVTISANTTTAPNGTLTADTLIEDTSNSTHRIFNNSAITVSTTNASTYSVYLKSAGRIRAWVRDNDIVGALFNLSNGTIVSTEGTATATITNVGDGWYRCTITKVNTTVNGRIVVYLDNGTSDTYTGNGTSGIFIWGAQLVEGTLPQTYFPTTDRLNVPRLDYSNGSSPSLLLEPQRTNLFFWSGQLSDASWVKSNCTITANSSISPDGTQTASLVDDGIVASTQHWFYQNPIFAYSTTYTISFYAKYVSRKYMSVNIYNGATSQYVDYDIQNGSILGSTGDVTASITSVGNGWYRVVYTRTIAASGSPNLRIALADDTGSETYTGSNKQVLIWGLQLEAGAYPSTYIETTTASVTRLVDSFSRNNIYTNGLITSSGGTWFAEFKNNLAYTGDTGGDFISIGDTLSTVGNNFRLYNSPSSLGRMEIRKTIASASTLLYTTTTDNVKMTIKWNGSTADVFVNGVKVVSATAFTTTLMENFITNIVASPKFIQQMDLFPTPLSDSECIRLTADYTDGSSVIGNYERYVNNLGGTVENLNGVTNLIQNLR